MLKYLLNIKYPQALWSQKILKTIYKNNIFNEVDNIYDIPCGNGVFTYIFNCKTKKRIIGIDIDEKKINFLNKYIKSKNRIFQKGDIFSTKFKSKSLWVFVNSLYLIKDISPVLENNINEIKYIIGVFPYINTKNYLYFKEKIDAKLNINEMDKESTIEFFENNGFELVDIKDSIYFNYHLVSKNKYVKFMVSTLFLFCEIIFKPTGNIYWIGVFKRKIA